MPSAFAPESAFFVAAERTRRIEFVVGVRPDDAGAQFAHDLENLAAFVGPNAGAQSVRRIVRALDRFFRRAKGHHAQDRTKNFLLRDAVRCRHPGEETRRIPVAFVRELRRG